MKKILFFIPAIIFTAFYGFIIIGTGLPIMLTVYIWIALFIISGILMSKNLSWGGLLGLIPGCHLMHMSTIDTGQVINIELPMGILVAAFYLLCSGYIFIKRKTRIDRS